MVCSFEDSILFINTASTAALSSYYSRTNLKMTKCISHIGFVSTCLKFGLKPDFISFTLNIHSASDRNRTAILITKKWLDTQRRSFYAKKTMLQNLIDRTESKLSKMIPIDQFQRLQNYVEERQTILFNELRNKKLKKLKRLSLQTPDFSGTYKSTTTQHSNPKYVFPPPFINLTETKLSDCELSLLNKGPKFSVYPIDKQSSLTARIVSDLATGLQGDVRLNTEKVRKIIYDMTTPPPPNTELRGFLSLKKENQRRKHYPRQS